MIEQVAIRAELILGEPFSAQNMIYRNRLGLGSGVNRRLSLGRIEGLKNSSVSCGALGKKRDPRTAAERIGELILNARGVAKMPMAMKSSSQIETQLVRASATNLLPTLRRKPHPAPSSAHRYRAMRANWRL